MVVVNQGCGLSSGAALAKASIAWRDDASHAAGLADGVATALNEKGRLATHRLKCHASKPGRARNVMSIYLRWRTIVACLVAAVGTAAAIAPADAADPPLPTAAPPAVSYAFGSFARGPLVLEDGGAFEVRSDGCWTTRFAISNTGAIAVAATVYYSWVDATGRQIAEIEVLDDTTYGPGTTTPFEAAACSRSIAASYARLSQASVRRTLEVDD